MRYNIEDIEIAIKDEDLANDDFLNTLKRRLENGQWESDEYKYLSLLPPDCSVLELGACIGFISCATNKILKNKKNHVVLEANPNLISILENNRKSNNCDFTIVNKILANGDGNIKFKVDKRSILGSTTELMPHNRISQTFEIEKISIETLEEDTGLSFDALICDIEGGEYELFENCLTQDFIKQLRFISVEFHWNANNSRNRCNRIVEKLKNYGFQITSFYAKTGQRQVFGVKK